MAHIREARLHEAKTIRELNLALFHNDQQYDQSYDTSWVERNHDYFEKCITEEDGLCVLAEIDDEIVGYLIGHFKPAEDFRILTKRTILENMFIKKRYRSQGIGSELINVFTKWSRENGAEVSQVTASAKNTDAVRFYKNNGFGNCETVLEMDLGHQP